MSLNILCQKSAYHRYGDLASYHYNRILHRPFAYAIYGKNVVNFAVNSTGIPRVFKGKEIDGVEQLREVYGELFEKMRRGASSDEFPILEKKLSQYPINQGICLGESLDFISRYLKDNAETTFETIEKISKQFSGQGTPEAQITQILYKAQDIEQLLQGIDTHIEEIEKKLEEDITNAWEKFQKKHDRIKQEMKELRGSAQEEFVRDESARVLDEVKEETKEIKWKIDREISRCSAELNGERLQSLAQIHDLHVQLNTVFVGEDIQQKTAPDLFNTRISQLSAGAYLVCLSNAPDSRPGHALAFIKTSENETYLFDPNLATVKFEKPEEFVSELWSTKGTCTMQVYNCHLK